jgi:hypothetical protein
VAVPLLTASSVKVLHNSTPKKERKEGRKERRKEGKKEKKKERKKIVFKNQKQGTITKLSFGINLGIMIG